MGGTGAARTVALVPGVKTQIIWSSFAFTTYSVFFSQPGVSVEWERNSTLPPFHTWGTHNTGQTFGATVAGAYCNFWMTSAVPLTLTIR